MSLRYAKMTPYYVILYTYRLFEYKTSCWIKEWAELSTWSRPIGISFSVTETVIYIKDLYGSYVPFLGLRKLKRTISLLLHVLLPVSGSLIHYLNTDGNPFGYILW